ncbi:MAG: hypothetical protein E7J94_08545 [Clostridium sp.]|nr:hypothetical protein [Clostridium sp.]
MKVWHITKDVGYGGHLLYNLTNNAKKIPEPLPWIEPSINCLYKEAVLSFMIGNYDSALTDLCLLMEHVLRAAILNDTDSGMQRTDSTAQLNKYGSLSEAIGEAKHTSLMDDCDMEWWDAVSRVIRNKTAHYVLPVLLKKCAQEVKLRKYINKYKLPEYNSEEWYESHLINWGAFYHGAGEELVEGFLLDVTKELKIVIANTKWEGDESWWISLKNQYDLFFSYEWSIDKLKYSFEYATKDLGKISK